MSSLYSSSSLETLHTNADNRVKKKNNCSAHLCPDAVAMGDGPLGGRGSSQVLISITTLSRVCKQVKALTLRPTTNVFMK